MDDVDFGLTSGERLLLCGVRLLAADAGCASLRPRFEHACGCAGAQAFRALQVFVQQLSLHGRRRIAVTPPAAGPPSADEALMLEAFACAQADDYQGLDARLARLTAAETPRALGAAACLIADAFAMNGLVLRGQGCARDLVAIARQSQDRPVSVVRHPDRAVVGDHQADGRAGGAQA